MPVVEVGEDLHGVEAVIDKDLTASRLALLVAADQLVILTEVSRVQVGYGTPGASELGQLTVAEARRAARRRRVPGRIDGTRRCGPASTSSPAVAAGP